MKKLPAISRADLLRGLLSPAGFNDNLAIFLGYERKPRISESVQGNNPNQSSTQNNDTVGELPPQPPEHAIEFPAKRPSLQFLMPTQAETLIPSPPKRDPGKPITDAELAVPWKERGLPLRPLVRWARLGFFLKNRLGVSVPGSRLDDRKLMRLAASGMPLVELPRQQRTTWAAQAVILRDDTSEMYPFSQDVDALCRRLRRERGSSGLRIVTLRNVPATRDISGIPGGTPILAISAMGQFTENVTARQAWQKLSRRLAFRDHSFSAINPCPQNRWEKELAESWPTAVWDRGQRLPRQGGMNSLKQVAGTSNVSLSTETEISGARFHRAEHVKNVLHVTVEQLLTLLSPASLIEPALLRQARLLLGRTADAGTEWDAWHHADCWQSMNCFGLRPGDAWHDRLRKRSGIAELQPTLVAGITRAIQEQHKTCSEGIAAEAELRSCLSGRWDDAAMKKIQQFFIRVIDRLRQLAEQPGSEAGKRSGLPAWFVDMVGRLSPEIRQHVEIQESIARGLALAHTWMNTPSIEVPRGVHPEYFAGESRDAASRIDHGGTPIDYVVAFNGVELEFLHGATPGCGHFPLARLQVAASGRFTAEVKTDTWKQHSLQPDTGTRTAIMVPATAAQIRIESNYGRLHFETAPRPAWASRMWYDRFGMAAEFLVGTVPFVLRWIPPGRFLMGSPEDEKGRRDEEGPQHEVTISRGFWMGETPVTQNQWAAVVDAGKAKKSFWKKLFSKDQIKSVPSRFQGPGDLPVEQVTWQDSSNFCQVLNALVPDSPNFTLPTEARWEYACRAGTQAAFYDGSPCTEPEGSDPALERLGWYGKNSGQKTQPVKGKLPNAWGLYDMHGNVWEWCADAWDRELYKSRIGVIVDPVNPGDDIANRVVRGGSWDLSARLCRSAFRFDLLPGIVWYDLGLRLSTGQEPVRFSAEPNVPERRSRG